MTTPRYAISIHTVSMVAAHAPRLLVPTPHPVETLGAARRWISRSAATWIAALAGTESGFIGSVLDEDGSEALAVEYGTDPDAEPVIHDREDLRAIRARRRKTTKTTTTATDEGEST